MTDNSTRLHGNRDPQVPRPSVEELIGCQAVREALGRHIVTELKQRNALRQMDPGDVFQEMYLRARNPGGQGPSGNVVNWLKKIATNYIIDELRKGRLRTRRSGELGPDREPSVLVENTMEVKEVIEAARVALNPRERLLLQLCLRDLSAEALASASGLKNAKAARDAKHRFYRKLRPVLIALGAN